MLLLHKFHFIPPFNDCLPSLTLIRSYAARKGTRERKAKKKVKVEVEKVAFVPHNQRNKDQMHLNRPKRKFDDSMLGSPIDDVYHTRFYRWKVYDFAEAINNHRETHHIDMYNKPNANVCVNIELNMQAEKKTRFVDNFTRMLSIPHKFDHGQSRTIIVFTKEPQVQIDVRNAGADLSGGIELIKELQNGNLSLHDFQYVIAHPNILPELVAVRGLMKRKFPNPKNGTLDIDLTSAVTKFLSGIEYSATKDEHEKDFGLIETVIGTLDMDEKHLEENFVSLIRDVYEMKPKRAGEFISRCLILSPPSREKFKINHMLYLSEPVEDEGFDDEAETSVAAV
ncbi:hypothetical protein FQA39_LY11289 [Lamprigera yunnana]|nr:hypothetical protein FQA39_LY11289 [Lamprigera yunnana]